jgi:hypothetical protein
VFGHIVKCGCYVVVLLATPLCTVTSLCSCPACARHAVTRDKCFSGTVKYVLTSSARICRLISVHPTRLPNVPRSRMSICILADAADIDRAKQIELEYIHVCRQFEKVRQASFSRYPVLNFCRLDKNKKLVKKYDAFLGFRGTHHQADPSSAWSRSLQG